ncbi:MAG: hypothetical protein GY725_25405 [bacterium]|nr:hypothetical protein [bacterium]
MKPRTEHWQALFEPGGIVVAGATSHPGKFGFSVYHNLKAMGFAGELYGTNLSAEPVLGDPTYTSIDELPAAARVDLVFSGVPQPAVEAVLRQAANRGARAVFIAGAGFAEAGAKGVAAQRALVELADELDLLIVGPNGQGIISTPVSMCAQIVAPMPPAGHIGIASQSGGFISTFGNYARQCGIGISRAVSAGNCAQIGVADCLDYFVDDPETHVGLVYLEDVQDSDDLVRRLARANECMPVVVVRSGGSRIGPRAVSAHTGSTATGPGFDDALRRAGVTIAPSIPEAWDAAAGFATQPLPAGPRTAVFSTAGGWAIQTAEAIERSELELVELPNDLRETIDGHIPPRWSRHNPIDLAGGETRDTIPDLMEVVAAHPEIDAIIYLGLGIQSNQAALLAAGPFHADPGLERIVAYHERQDTRFATAASDASAKHHKPILTATELAITNPENPGPTTVRATGRMCYASGNAAVTTLEHLWRDSRFRRNRARNSGESD